MALGYENLDLNVYISDQQLRSFLCLCMILVYSSGIEDWACNFSKIMCMALE
jgi:hypothetical protein